MIDPNTLPADVRAAYPWTGVPVTTPAGTMHVLDEGPRDAPVLLCVHGNPTWSFYWRAIVAHYSDRFRVVVPDHLGCGLSDKPQDWTYRLADHVDNLLAVIDQLGLTDITFVVHDWGGAIGSGAATRRPELVRAMIVTNTGAWNSPDIPPSIATCKIPVFGELAVRGLNGFARAAVIRATEKGLSPVARRGLLFPYDSWANRIATLEFVHDIPRGPSHPTWPELERIDTGLADLADKPVMLLWGDADWCFTPTFRAGWEERFPDAEVHAWADVGHYVMEDATDRVLAAMDGFLARVLAPAA